MDYSVHYAKRELKFPLLCACPVLGAVGVQGYLVCVLPLSVSLVWWVCVRVRAGIEEKQERPCFLPDGFESQLCHRSCVNLGMRLL